MSIIGSHGAKLDLRVKQGASFSMDITLANPDGSPVDLTGAIARAQIRKAITDDAPAAIFACTVASPQIRLELDAAQTAAIPVIGPVTTYFWDMEIVWPTGRVDSPLWGYVIVRAEATK
jgi:hypothetical protein